MKPIVAFAALFLSAVAAAPAAAPAPDGAVRAEPQPRYSLVTVRGASDRAAVRGVGGRLVSRHLGVWRVRSSAVANLRGRGAIEYAEPERVTARDEDVDKIIGLEVGADDYLTKPFNPRELVARVKSVLRRAAPERREAETKQLRHGQLVVDAGRREVRVGEQEIQLAPKEFDLLWELLDHKGLVLTRDQLLERVWGYTFAGDTRTVDVHVRQLRRKLGDASPIVTVWGVGYKVSPAPRETPQDTVSAASTG